jgi:hypothetical protein
MRSFCALLRSAVAELCCILSVVYRANRRLTQRAPDWWEAARFQAVSAAWSWFR